MNGGREICLRLFNDVETVPFSQFIKYFSEICFTDLTVMQNKKVYRKLLSVLLCDNEYDDTVSKYRFCNVVGWFAPIDKNTDCVKFFGRMKDLLCRRYFHGFLSETKAEHQLKQLWDGSSYKQSYYTIRFSESEVGSFILTFIDSLGNIQHEKILNRNGHLHVETIYEEYENWSKLKQAIKRVWSLNYHLSKSPYGHLFRKGVFG